MKLLFLTNSLETGGIETNLVRLSRAFVTRGHEVVVASRGGNLVSALEAVGGIHAHCPIGLSLDSVRTLRSIVMDVTPDLIHSFSASASASFWAARLGLPKGSRPPMVASIMGLKDFPEERDLKTRSRVFLTTLGAYRVIVIAPAIADVLSSLPVSQHRLIEMPVVGIDDLPSSREVREDRRRFRTDLGLSDEMPVVISVGNLEPRKSHELLVRTAAHVVRGYPAARFFIVGEGSMRPQLEREIRSHGLESSVALLGDRLDAARLLRAADVYVRPGVLEGFVGITVLEAQAAGVPVVSFETEDVKLAIEDGRTGVLVECGDVEGLAKRIMTLIDDPDLARKIGEAGGEAVRRRFSIESITDALEDFYMEIVGNE